MFKTEYYIAGIGPSSGGNIVLLTYNEADVVQEVLLYCGPNLQTANLSYINGRQFILENCK